jgi:flavin reductase (DIM6/NTAB) family NADH-FMN oxidoreductase RutF
MTVHAAPTAIDPRELRAAMSRFATGVAVVTTFDGEKREGLTINSFSSLSLDPPLVVWSLRKNASSLATFQRAAGFAVNVLCADRRDLSRHFATPHPDKFLGSSTTMAASASRSSAAISPCSNAANRRLSKAAIT